MKKMISIPLFAIVIAFAAAGYATAQTGDKDIAFIPAKNHAAYVSFITKSYAAVAARDTSATTNATSKTSKAELKAIKANNKALRSFKSIYRKNTPNAEWTFAQDGIIASFSKDDVKTNVVYKKNGNWLHTLTYYPESKTPADIIAVMDAVYPKDDVKLTVKVEEGNMLFYIVQLEGKTTFKKVSVYDGDVNLLEEYTKAN
jgi:hypothetical protein